MTTQPIHLPRDAHATAKAYAAAKGITIGAAVAELITCALNRKAALAKYRKAKT